jgi:hypothetical protein
VGGGVQIVSTRHSGHQWPIVPAPRDYDAGEIGGMIGRGNRSTRSTPAPVPLCPPQTPHAARTRTRAAAVGSQRLTAWATARPYIFLTFFPPLLGPSGPSPGRPPHSRLFLTLKTVAGDSSEISITLYQITRRPCRKTPIFTIATVRAYETISNNKLMEK